MEETRSAVREVLHEDQKQPFNISVPTKITPELLERMREIFHELEEERKREIEREEKLHAARQAAEKQIQAEEATQAPEAMSSAKPMTERELRLIELRSDNLIPGACHFPGNVLTAFVSESLADIPTLIAENRRLWEVNATLEADVGNPSKAREFWVRQPLGKMPDRLLAEKIGLSEWAVRRQRIKQEIPLFAPFQWDEQPFGQIPDAEIGRRVGVEREAVRYQRKKRGIPKYQREKAEA